MAVVHWMFCLFALRSMMCRLCCAKATKNSTLKICLSIGLVSYYLALLYINRSSNCAFYFLHLSPSISKIHSCFPFFFLHGPEQYRHYPVGKYCYMITGHYTKYSAPNSHYLYLSVIYYSSFDACFIIETVYFL